MEYSGLLPAPKCNRSMMPIVLAIILTAVATGVGMYFFLGLWNKGREGLYVSKCPRCRQNLMCLHCSQPYPQPPMPEEVVNTRQELIPVPYRCPYNTE